MCLWMHSELVFFEITSCVSCSNKANSSSLPQPKEDLFPSENCKPLVHLKSFNNCECVNQHSAAFSCSFWFSPLHSKDFSWFWWFLFFLSQFWCSCSNVDFFFFWGMFYKRSVWLEFLLWFFFFLLQIAQDLKTWKANGWKCCIHTCRVHRN